MFSEASFETAARDLARANGIAEDLAAEYLALIGDTSELDRAGRARSSTIRTAPNSLACACLNRCRVEGHGNRLCISEKTAMQSACGDRTNTPFLVFTTKSTLQVA